MHGKDAALTVRNSYLTTIPTLPTWIFLVKAPFSNCCAQLERAVVGRHSQNGCSIWSECGRAQERQVAISELRDMLELREDWASVEGSTLDQAGSSVSTWAEFPAICLPAICEGTCDSTAKLPNRVITPCCCRCSRPSLAVAHSCNNRTGSLSGCSLPQENEADKCQPRSALHLSLSYSLPCWIVWRLRVPVSIAEIASVSTYVFVRICILDRFVYCAYGVGC